LFSYTLLFKLDKLADDENESVDDNRTIEINYNSTAIKFKLIDNLKISNAEIILLFWIFSIIAKEMRKVR
jgi:hypothetical protein